jgi:hypothetical protein
MATEYLTKPAFLGGTIGTPPSPSPPKTTFYYSGVEAGETPAPMDWGPSGVFDSPTGDLVALEGPAELVQKASALIRDHGFLPVDQDASERIDRLMAKRQEGAPLVALTRTLDE